MQTQFQQWRRMVLSLVLLIGMESAKAATATAPTINTSKGAVSGQLIEGVRQYLGIPYAKPPVGALRWQPPQSPQAWSGIRDGSKAGNRCAQLESSFGAASDSEDCLFLNVFVPENIGTRKLPVMVWIHGGAFVSGASTDYEMKTLALKGQAVIVSLNYRLGVFGFFGQSELQANQSPINFGLLDQQAALRWIQGEIDRFGGDSRLVTIFGESAGGASVCMHLVSPASSGLFHRAINQSGPCGMLSNLTASALIAKGNELGENLACPAGAGQLACLQQKSATEILASVGNKTKFSTSGLAWGPVQDGISALGHPVDLIRAGAFNRVPVLMGTNHDEGRTFVATDYHLSNLWPVTKKQLNQAIETVVGASGVQAAALQLAYSADNYGSRDKALAALITDYRFSCHAIKEAQLLSSQVPTYFYEFNEPQTPGAIDPYMQMGAFHGAELRYLFQAQLPGPTFNLPLSTSKQIYADRMIQYWSHFSRNGYPTSGLNMPWLQFSVNDPTVFSLRSDAYATSMPSVFRQNHRCKLLGI